MFSRSSAVAPASLPTEHHVDSFSSFNSSNSSLSDIQTPLASAIAALRRLNPAEDRPQQGEIEQVIQTLTDAERLLSAPVGSHSDLHVFLQLPRAQETREAPVASISSKACEFAEGKSSATGGAAAEPDAGSHSPTRMPGLEPHHEALANSPTFQSWSFNVLDLARETDGHALQTFAVALFYKLDLCGMYGIAFDMLSRFFAEIERNYCYNPDSPNAYHTALHGADVLASVAHFVTVPVVADLLTTQDALALFTAAAVHDFRHPGVNQSFLVKTRHSLAVQYNDQSVLEHFHLAETFRVMWSTHGDLDITRPLSDSDLRAFRNTVIKLVLATDLAESFTYVSSFKSLFPTQRSDLQPLTTYQEPEKKLVLMQMLLKCADIAHPAKDWDIHLAWSEMIEQEFFNQGDSERELGLPISPLCNREKDALPPSQQGFIKFVARPCFGPMVDFLQAADDDSGRMAKVWSENLRRNAANWGQRATQAASEALS